LSKRAFCYKKDIFKIRQMDIKKSAFYTGTELQWEPFGDGRSRQILGYDNHIMLNDFL